MNKETGEHPNKKKLTKKPNVEEIGLLIISKVNVVILSTKIFPSKVTYIMI